jgi:hypothetical protein
VNRKTFIHIGYLLEDVELSVDIKRAENSIYMCCSNIRNGHLSCRWQCSSVLAVTIVNDTWPAMVFETGGEFDQCKATNRSCHWWLPGCDCVVCYICIYQTTWHHTPEDSNLHSHHWENVRSHKNGCSVVFIVVLLWQNIKLMGWLRKCHIVTCSYQRAVQLRWTVW